MPLQLGDVKGQYKGTMIVCFIIEGHIVMEYGPHCRLVDGLHARGLAINQALGVLHTMSKQTVYPLSGYPWAFFYHVQIRVENI